MQFDHDLSLDFETFCELDLTEVGSSVYSRHRSCEVLMLAFALDDYKVEQWVPLEDGPMPRDLAEMLLDPRVCKRAWNKPFEWAIFANCLDMHIPHEQWRDTMVMAYANSFPGKLEKVGPILRLPSDKQKDRQGKALIRTFCGPRKPTKGNASLRNMPADEPVKWEQFKSYNRQDVETEREVKDTLLPWDLPEHEWALWVLDQQINQRGLPVNRRVVRSAIGTAAELTDRHMAEMRELTGLENPNSQQQMLGWLRDQGYPYNDLKKGHIARRIEQLSSDVTDGHAFIQEIKAEYRVLELRQETSKASIKKYDAIERATDEDDRLRNTLQFAGAARTWRWSGRIFQPQNLVRPPGWIEKHQVLAVNSIERLRTRELELLWGSSSVMDVISACGRPVIQASEGMVFVDADLNAIENRVLGWLAGDRKILAVFDKKLDPYLDFATYLYHESYDALKAEYKSGKGGKRQISKPAVLGCGYMLSAGVLYEDSTTGEMIGTGLIGYAQNMGIKLTVQQAQKSVETWRSTFEDAVQYWYDIENAAKRCIRNRKAYDAGPVWFDIDGPFMRMNLPSGRSLKYVRPKLENKMMPWGKMKEVVTYEGQDDKGNWNRLQTHPGKLTENADQAISRDLLAHGMMLADREGLDVCLHVHDQILAEVREDQAEKWLKVLEQCMGETPVWAKGLPMFAKGHVSKYFIKD